MCGFQFPTIPTYLTTLSRYACFFYLILLLIGFFLLLTIQVFLLLYEECQFFKRIERNPTVPII
jgi:hypothetical protein